MYFQIKDQFSILKISYQGKLGRGEIQPLARIWLRYAIIDNFSDNLGRNDILT